MEYYLVMKNKWNFAIYNNMDRIEDYAKQNKSVSKRQISYDFTHMWNLINKTSKQRRKWEKSKPRNIPLATENKLMVTRGEMGGGIGEIGDGD